MRRLALIFLLLAGLALAGTLVLAGSGELAIPWFAMSGGGTSNGAPYGLSGTAGQPAAGDMSGGDFTIGSGYWSGHSAPAPENPSRLYLPLVIK